MRFWLAWLGAGLLLGVIFDVAWWAVVAHPLDAARGSDQLVIPPGTGAAIQAATAFAFAPESYIIPAGGHLTVINKDTVSHTVGSTSIPPGSTGEVTAAASGELFCTVHPQGHIDVTLGTSPPLIGMALLAGVVSLASAVAGWILRSPSAVLHAG